MIKKLLFILLAGLSYGQSCETTFMTVDNTNNIKQWYLNSGVITGGSTILTVPFSVTSLDYSGDPANPTFFCGDYAYGLKRYDSATWTTLVPSVIVYNGGGYGNKHYYVVGSTNLHYYDGSSVTSVATPQQTVADIPVDSQGRAYIFTGPNPMTTGLKVYDGTTVVANYTCSFNAYNTYGAFFLNDTMYLLKGNITGTVNPYTLTPVIINGTIASLGTPISFVCPNCGDATSCNMNQLGLNVVNLKPVFFISPNPTNGIINISSAIPIRESVVYSIDGRIIKKCDQTQIDLTDLRIGIYVLKALTFDGEIFTKLIEKK